MREPMIAAACAALAMAVCQPARAEPGPMTWGPIVRTALPGCDAPTPVRARHGHVYSNVSDCSLPGSPGKLSSAWAQIQPEARYVSSGVTTRGDGGLGLKLSGAMVDPRGGLVVIQRNITTAGGMRVGSSPSVSRPSLRWGPAIPGIGWASWAHGSPDAYAYLVSRDAPRAYGTADRVDLVRVPKGREADLAGWQAFAGTPWRPEWVPWSRRSERRPIITDPGHVNRPILSHIGACWLLAVTAPPPPHMRGGGGLAVYTSTQPFGPWTSRLRIMGRNMGESAQFSPLWPGQILTSENDRLTWRTYKMPPGC